ncbi:hypothetical protein FRC03_011443 [Tulasnella sp. 419]|nr:hypothetical protein FRC03_011443 [Tulasnella sp. 419]
MDPDSSSIWQTDKPGKGFKPFSFSDRLVLLLIVQTGIISLIAVVSLLALILWNHVRRGGRFQFLRRPVDYFFFGLLLSDIFRGVGHVMGVAWVAKAGILPTTSCTIEAAFRHVGSVGEAFFTLSITIYTFVVIYLKWHIPNKQWLPWVVTGSIVLFLVLMVAICFSIHRNPPFYGPAGLWCWVVAEYPGEKIGLEYGIFWFVALTNFLLYVPLFLSLRRVARSGWPGESSLHRRETMSIAIKMLVYPVAYIILVLPMSIIRFIGFYNPNTVVPAGWRAIAGVTFGASGFVNSLLYVITRPRLLPSFRIGADDDEVCSETISFASAEDVETKASDILDQNGRTSRRFRLDHTDIQQQLNRVIISDPATISEFSHSGKS